MIVVKPGNQRLTLDYRVELTEESEWRDKV